MKILITGGSGLLGQYLNVVLSQNHTILTLFNSNPGNCGSFNSRKINLLDTKSLEKIFIDFIPDVVIHTAAITSPILPANISAKNVYEINVIVTKNIAEFCDKLNAKLIYTSTDLVYAGYRGSMLKEDSKLIPASLYAETKLMGEVKIQQTFDNYLILRTALLFGFGLNHSTNHFHQMYMNLKQGKQVKLFTDQFRTPLSLFEASRIINELVSNNIKTDVANLGGLERVSRYELGERLCEIAKFDKSLLTKITMDDVPGLQKVEDVSMNTDKLQSYGIKQKSIDEMILEIVK
ncbi:MAG: SDR family oxidoreductase [Ignavibacteriaceae bacterium]|nr:SDR family oxidoreductase [Ignavibacterium sp.]MCC6255863.1 SDR family oxidoreductase [Ignavibacteriaceae bacterium]HMN24842.1 SDR family oxidoreductase [Ignavibacteriaceae bacterium]HRP94212.1 SDR family oxidoreductase [Ignavibacteriaceae bacterium]